MSKGQTVNVQRHGVAISVGFGALSVVSEAVDIQHATAGLLEITSEFDGDTLTFRGCTTKDGTFRSIEDSTGTAVSVVATGGTYLELNDAVMKAGFIKVATNDGTAAAASLNLILK